LGGAALFEAFEGPAADWVLGGFKSEARWNNQMQSLGWTSEQITNAIANGESFPATNMVNPQNPAVRFVNPVTGQSVVQDSITREILHLGGKGFRY
jgi:hypothetical protein